MSRPKDSISESNFVIGYCIRGYDLDPAPNQNGIGVYLPQYHGNNVKKNQIGFSPMVMPPNKSGLTEFNGVPDPGQAMVCLRTKEPSGATSLVVLGGLTVNRETGGHPANINLNTALKALVEAFSTEINVRIPPNVKETVVDGARVRQIQEKGQKHKHDLVKGMPSHGATYPLAGMTQKQLSNISTATQSFSSILTGSMMAAIPGVSFSVGNILSSLTSSVADELLSSLSPELSQGLQNTFTLMQSMEINEGGGFSTMGKVDPTTYLANATNLLKGNQSFGEIISNLQRLQTDTSLFGLDKLTSGSFDVPTAFGIMKMSVSPTGEIVNLMPDEMQSAIKAFTGLMTSGAGFPSGTMSNMFGNSASVMSSLFDRLPESKQTNAKNMMEKVIASGVKASQNINNFNDLLYKGGDVLGFFE